MKNCAKCKLDKPKTEFSKRLLSQDGLRPNCKACAAKDRAKNRQKIAKHQAEYRAKNRERILAHAAEYYLANREIIVLRKAKYYAANPEKFAEHGRTRRARQLNADGKHTHADILKIFERQRGICANCLVKLFKSGKQKFHIDHIVPLSRGGSDWPSNLQCLCPLCNSRKHAKDPLEWARQNGRLI
jgi:hypothetical protein